MKKIILIAALALAGCGETPAEKAEKEYELIEKTPLAEGQRCGAAIKVRDAYREEGNADAYELWTLLAQVDCR